METGRSDGGRRTRGGLAGYDAADVWAVVGRGDAGGGLAATVQVGKLGCDETKRAGSYCNSIEGYGSIYNASAILFSKAIANIY